MVYLGGLITDDMSARPELTCRLGEANRAFKALVVLWSHANICTARKIEIYMAAVSSKLHKSFRSVPCEMLKTHL